MRRSGVVGLLAAAGMLALGACGTVHLAAPAASSPGSSSSSSSSSSPSRSAGTPQQRADSSAAAMVAAFVPPPGARELAKAPSADHGALRNPGFTFTSLDQVDKTSWWLVPGSPQAVANYEHAHLPPPFTLDITGSNGITGIAGVTAVTSFKLPAVPEILNFRELLLTMVPAADGDTAVRVDAFVAWQPPHPTAEMVPAAVKVVTVTPEPGGNDRSKPPGPVTITDPAKVRRLVSAFNGLLPDVRGLISCPFDDGRGVQLTFRARIGGPGLAVAFADAMGCGDVAVQIGSRRDSFLGGATLGQLALAEAGLKWKVIQAI